MALEEKTNSCNKESLSLRQVEEERDNLEEEIKKYNSEIRTYKQLLDTAKKSKAEEIIALNRTVI